MFVDNQKIDLKIKKKACDRRSYYDFFFSFRYHMITIHNKTVVLNDLYGTLHSIPPRLESLQYPRTPL